MLYKLLGVIGVSSLLIAAPFSAAKAAEMPVKAPPAPAPMPYTWTGFYFGGNAGAAWDHISSWCTDATVANCETAPVDVVSHSQSNFVGGGQVGFRWEFPSSWVIGVEGMFDGLELTSSGPSCVSVAPSCAPGGAVFPNRVRSTQFDDLFSVTGQVGYAWDRLLLYGKGGVAWTELELDADNLSPGGFDLSEKRTLTGATGGIGLEYLATRNVSLGIEYDFYGFSPQSRMNEVNSGGVLITCAFCFSNNNNLNTYIQTVTARLNWRFDWFAAPAPVETRD